MITEGRNAVREVLKSGKTVEKLIIQKGANGSIQELITLARSSGVKIFFEEKEILDKQSPSGRHQGVICYTTEYKYFSVDDILATAENKGENPFIIILDGVSDPHNLGSIIRTAVCSGAHGIIIPKHRACGVNETVIKVSEGATEYMKVALVTNINDAIRELKDKFINIVVADMDGKLCYDVDLKVPLALVVGGEGEGVKRLTKSFADYVISLPMKGEINSLNASVAMAVASYEIVRQRLN